VKALKSEEFVTNLSSTVPNQPLGLSGSLIQTDKYFHIAFSKDDYFRQLNVCWLSYWQWKCNKCSGPDHKNVVLWPLCGWSEVQ